jgi:hypothetical protein
MNKLSEKELTQLKEALLYLHVEELKSQLEALNLSSKGFNKNELIQRIIHYAVTGSELLPLEIPTVSKALHGTKYSLNLKTRMLLCYMALIKMM